MKQAEKIVKLREQHNLTQKELAQKIGVSTGLVAEWEAEDAAPSVAEIIELSTVFSVSTDSLLKDDEEITNSAANAKANKKHGKKSVFKRVWFWLVIGVVAAAAMTAVLFSFNQEVKPLLDENGMPVFVDFTEEVYTNAESYLGYHVELKGQVFQNLGTNEETKGIQIWLDPDTCEQNVMIYHTSGEQFKNGDYVVGTGYIKAVQEYNNTFGAESSAPLVYASELKRATYIDVMSPTIDAITPTALKYEKIGYSLSVDKVEFAENETRLYLTVSNNGKAELYVDADSSIIIQNGKQYNMQGNYEADYEEIPYVVQRGASSSGIVTFPAIENSDFDYSIELHSDDFDEKFDEFTFKIGKEETSVYVPVVLPVEMLELSDAKYEKYGYALSVDKVEFYEDETLVYLTATNNGSATMYVDADASIVVQNQKQHNSQSGFDADYEELPYSIAKGTTATGVVSFPVFEAEKFEYSIEVYSNNYEEEFDAVRFLIALDSVEVLSGETDSKKNNIAPPNMAGVAGTYQMDDETLYFNSDGSVVHKWNDRLSGDSSEGYGTWSISGWTINFSLNWGYDTTNYTASIVSGGIMWDSIFWNKVG